MGTNGQLSRLRRKRFRGAFSIGDRGRAHCAGDLRLGNAPQRREAWLAGSDHFYSVAANICPRKSSRRGHVAGVVRHACALGGVRTDSTPNAQRSTPNAQFRRNKSNIKHQSSNIFVVVVVAHVLLRFGAGLSCERTSCLGAIVDSCSNNHFRTRCAVGPALQVCLWNFTHARHDRALGNSGADSNAWRIFHGWNWSTRDRSFIRDHGRPRREFPRYVSAAFAILFRDCFCEFFSLVDQTAMAGSKITTGAKSRRHPPSPRLRRTRRRRLQRKIDRQVSRNRHRHHFHHLYFDQNEITALHATGVSIAVVAASAPSYRPGKIP